MTIKKNLILLIALCGVAFAQGKQKIAIYVAGNELNDTQKRTLESNMLSLFLQSGRYMAVERNAAFLNSIAQERNKQRDGSVDFDQVISLLGKEYGIQVVCVVDYVRAFDIHSFSARLIDLESAKIIGFGETELENEGEIGEAADLVFEQMNYPANTGKSKITVYVASKEIQNSSKRLIGTKILAALIHSGRYTAIERGDAFLSNIVKEREKQRNGSVDEKQVLSRLGKEAGVQNVLVADYTNAFNSHNLSARLINLESAEIMVSSNVKMNFLNEIGSASDNIVEKIIEKQFAKELAKERAEQARIDSLNQVYWDRQQAESLAEKRQQDSLYQVEQAKLYAKYQAERERRGCPVAEIDIISAVSWWGEVTINRCSNSNITENEVLTVLDKYKKNIGKIRVKKVGEQTAIAERVRGDVFVNSFVGGTAKPFGASSVYFAAYLPTVKSTYAYEGKELTRQGLNILFGLELLLPLNKNLLGTGLFIGGGALGKISDIREFIVGAEVKGMFWLWEERIAIPISFGIAGRRQSMEIENKLVAEFIDEPAFLQEETSYLNENRNISRWNFDIMPSIDLQFFMGDKFSLYAGYMYRITPYNSWGFNYKISGKYYEGVSSDSYEIPDKYNPLKDSKETIFGAIPGTLRAGIKIHAWD
ncbi:hypothetical protein AGMMS49938_07060 [Fibrobacterales bacterium]|nr:hypothetical protein AGMMS49938_07060 [Fibrobacterales bacterium]